MLQGLTEMIYKRKLLFIVWTTVLFSFISYSHCSTSSTTGYSSTTDYSTTDGYSSTTDPPTTPYTDTTTEEVTESSDNALWMIIGVICGVALVIAIIVVAVVVYAINRSKRIHPHSDTDSFYTESESQSDSRPTTASHVFIEPEEEAMSKPVTMTPFELRKLYVETFPYKNWKRGYDGSLRPQMSLRFVDPKLYARSKGDEQTFREKIYNYENSDSLTLRSSALSRMMHQNVMPTMHEMEPVYEQPLPPIQGQPPTQLSLRTPRTASVKKSEDVELI